VTARCFVRDTDQTKELRAHVEDLFSRYKEYKTDIQLAFVDPQVEPALVRAEGIRNEGEIILQYQGRKQRVNSPDEESITNALLKISRNNPGKLGFITGHGERSPRGRANHDLGSFGQQMAQSGIVFDEINISEFTTIPDEYHVLVIAGPQTSYLEIEITKLSEFIQRGGHLLWLSDPDSKVTLPTIAADLGIEFLPGVIVDPSARQHGLKDARFAVVTRYVDHPITQHLGTTLFPFAQGIKLQASEWQAQEIFHTLAEGWSETGDLNTKVVKYEEGDDIAGPLAMAVALHRTLPETQKAQRVVVVGDGDFISNAFLGNGSNLEAGLNIINWLMHEDQLISLPPKVAPDTRLEMGVASIYTITGFFLIVVPLAMIITGVIIWNRRRKL
jgi:ABC-type uncharacterized transport system involved in gliding motility auxiliary subunit